MTITKREYKLYQHYYFMTGSWGSAYCMFKDNRDMVDRLYKLRLRLC